LGTLAAVRIQNFLDTGMVESFAVDDFGSGLDDPVFGVWLHAILTVICDKNQEACCSK
jgi:hypothetical protein